MADRSLLARWKAGDVTLGAWCMMPGALGVEIVAGQGFDWMVIDMQHGCMACGPAQGRPPMTEPGRSARLDFSAVVPSATAAVLAGSATAERMCL